MHLRMQRFYAGVHHLRKPVSSETSRTFSPASAMAFAVPPVDTSSTPWPARARAKSISPDLSETESRPRDAAQLVCHGRRRPWQERRRLA